MNYANRYRNLWAPELKVKKPDFYENNAPQIGEHRGVRVFKLFDHGYDFVLAGACITQRAGASELARTIDEVLDGEHPVADAVAAHLRGLGFRPLTYAEAGRRHDALVRGRA